MGINHINAANVTMHSHGRIILRDIPKHTLEVNHFSVSNVAMPFHEITVLKGISKHNWDKPFQCSQCYKAFSNTTNLESHISTHKGDKPF